MDNSHFDLVQYRHLTDSQKLRLRVQPSQKLQTIHGAFDETRKTKMLYVFICLFIFFGNTQERPWAVLFLCDDSIVAEDGKCGCWGQKINLTFHPC